MSIDARIESASVQFVAVSLVTAVLVNAVGRGRFGATEVSGLLVGLAGGTLAFLLWCVSGVGGSRRMPAHALALMVGPLGCLWIMFISPGFARGYVAGASVTYLCCMTGKDLAEWMRDRQAKARDASHD